MTITTRDATLPLVYSQTLESLSLGPLRTALHQLLPHERTTRAVPHLWSWRAVRPLLHEAARLVPLERRVAPPWHWVSHTTTGDAPACLFQFNDEPALRALGLFQEETEAPRG